MSKFFLKLLVFLFFALSLKASLSERFVPASSIAALVGSEALWQNPSGLAFLDGSELLAAYMYDFRQEGNRHHAALSYASNWFNLLSFGLGLHSKIAMAKKSEVNLGSDLSAIVGLGLALTRSTSFGLSFMKSHNFLHEKSTDTRVSFGFQSRFNKYLALGGLYQEVNDGYFKAPMLAAGLAYRPLGELLTFGVDSRWAPRGQKWSEGFRLDPVFSIKALYSGFGLSLGAEIPGIKTGWTRPIFSFALDFNFEHWAFSLASLVKSAENNYALGASIRGSRVELDSIEKSSDIWVKLNINEQGSLEQRKAGSFKFLNKEHSPLAILALLKRMAQDKRIEGVVINISGFSFGDARAQEWRHALLALREAKKRVVVYLDQPSERDYYIATAAERIYMNKEASISLTRFQKTLVYLADLLEKIGIKAESITAGSYKSAPRMFTHAYPQKEELEVYQNILGDFYENFLDETARARGLSKEKLIEIFANSEIRAPDASQEKLVDKALYQDEITDDLEQWLNKPLSFYGDYQERLIKNNSWQAPKKIVVIPIEGEIVDDRVYPTLLPIFGTKSGALDIVDEIDEALLDPEVAALVIRINSPGGSASAGARIYRALYKAREQKPIIASMSDVAASAGYLIASATNYIFAEANTITGSIGVFSLYFSGEHLAQKLGVRPKELSVIKNPEPNYFHKLSADQRLEAQKLVSWYYENFISSVASGINLSREEVKKSADGHVWLGHEAFTRKLIQEIGGFAQALDAARKLAKIPDQEEVILEIRPPGAPEFFSLGSRLVSFLTSAPQEEITHLSSLAKPYIKALEYYRLNGAMQARLPFNVLWE